MQELTNFIEAMRATSSSTDKVKIIKESSSYIHTILEYTYNPFKQYYVTSKTCIKNKDKILIEKFLKQKEEGIPLDYILNSSKFYEYEFFVDSRVLIPRPETEIIIDYVNNHFSSSVKVLDAGTGSGCIGISIALQNPSLKVYGSDCSADALDVAMINKNNLNVDNFSLVHADWLSSFKTLCK